MLLAAAAGAAGAAEVAAEAPVGDILSLPVAGLIGLAVGLFASMPTGPLNFLVIRRGFEGRRYAGLATAVGGTIIDTIFCGLCLFGLPEILGRYIDDQTVRAFMAAIIMAYGAYFIWRGPGNLAKPGRRKPQDYFHIQNAFLNGLTITIFNPGLLGSWVVMTAVLLTHRVVDSAASKFLFCAGSFVGTLIWLGALLFTVARYRRYIRQQWVGFLMRAFGVMMVGMGLAVVLKPLYDRLRGG